VPHSKVLPIIGLISALSLSSLWLVAAVQPSQAPPRATVNVSCAAQDTLSPFKTPQNHFVTLPACPPGRRGLCVVVRVLRDDGPL
jgi:hypothetical protein